MITRAATVIVVIVFSGYSFSFNFEMHCDVHSGMHFLREGFSIKTRAERSETNRVNRHDQERGVANKTTQSSL
jgi:hypothetical protein